MTMLLNRVLALALIAAVTACAPAQREQPKPPAPSLPVVGGAGDPPPRGSASQRRDR